MAPVELPEAPAPNEKLAAVLEELATGLVTALKVEEAGVTAGAAVAPNVAVLAAFGSETAEAPKADDGNDVLTKPELGAVAAAVLLAVSAAVALELAVLVKPNDKGAAPASGATALELAAVPVLLDVALAPLNEKPAPVICMTHRQKNRGVTLPQGTRQALSGCGCGKESTKIDTQ